MVAAIATMLMLQHGPHTSARSMSTFHTRACISTQLHHPGTTTRTSGQRRRLAQGPGTWNNDEDCQGNYFLELEDAQYKGYCLTQFDNNGNNIRIMPCQKTVGQLWTLNYDNLQLGSSSSIRNVASQLQTPRCLQVGVVLPRDRPCQTTFPQ